MSFLEDISNWLQFLYCVSSLTEAPSGEPRAEEFSATKAVYVWKTMTTPGSIVYAV